MSLELEADVDPRLLTAPFASMPEGVSLDIRREGGRLQITLRSGSGARHELLLDILDLLLELLSRVMRGKD